jgi:hypothetical protein
MLSCTGTFSFAPFALDNKKYLTSANAEQKKVLDLGQCGDFMLFRRKIERDK